jgi:hypothetical protein
VRADEIECWLPCQVRAVRVRNWQIADLGYGGEWSSCLAILTENCFTLPKIIRTMTHFADDRQKVMNSMA